MADVFLSYKREDRAAAKEIADAIEKHGYSVFFDAEIGVGEAWNSRIAHEIEQAKCVAVLWSSRSSDIAAGEWVHNEARKGKSRSILAPALIGDCEIPLEFSSVQAADLRLWRGDPSETEWTRFVERIGACVQKKPQNIKAQPWRRRWVRIAAGIVAGAALAAGVTYAIVAKPWETPQTVQTTSGDLGSGAAPQAGAPPAAAVSADLPGSVERVLQLSITSGDCEGLRLDIDSFRADVPQIARYERAYMRECQGRATQLASVGSSAPLPTSTPAAAAPSAPSSPPPATGAGTNFLASLRARDEARLTRAQIDEAARDAGLEGAVLAAVVQVEGGRAGFEADGRPKILFEPHIFSRLTQRRFDAEHANVSYPSWGARPYPAGQAARWAQLEQAFALDPDAALSATSWGLFQPLGLNFRALGFSDAQSFARSISRSEQNQLRALVAFLRANRMIEPLQRRDWASFARAYNGSGQVDRYVAQLAAAYARTGQAPSTP